MRHHARHLSGKQKTKMSVHKKLTIFKNVSERYSSKIKKHHRLQDLLSEPWINRGAWCNGWLPDPLTSTTESLTGQAKLKIILAPVSRMEGRQVGSVRLSTNHSSSWSYFDLCSRPNKWMNTANSCEVRVLSRPTSLPGITSPTQC